MLSLNLTRFRSLATTGLLTLLAATVQVVAVDKTEEYASGKTKGKYKLGADGVKHGPFVEFYENGKLRAKGSYKAGEISGQLNTYYASGAVLCVAEYKAGVLHGRYTEFTPQGGRRLAATYKDGLLSSLLILGGGESCRGADLPVRGLGATTKASRDSSRTRHHRNDSLDEQGH